MFVMQNDFCDTVGVSSFCSILYAHHHQSDYGCCGCSSSPHAETLPSNGLCAALPRRNTSIPISLFHIVASDFFYYEWSIFCYSYSAE